MASVERRDGHPTDMLLMTAADFEALEGKLERLARPGRAELAERLRDARSYGNDSNNDEYHALLEERMVFEARIAQLEEIRARAVVVDSTSAPDGTVGIGSIVTLVDLASGTQSRFRVGSAGASLEHDAISVSSPVGKAIVGTVAGAVVTVELPNGRSRTVRVDAVEAA